MRCRHCNRLCNAESLYGVSRTHKDMEKKHIDFLCTQIQSKSKGKFGLLRIIGGEPLLSEILDYAVRKFEELISKGFADSINIVTNGTIKPHDKIKPYLVYAPICVGEMIKTKGRELTKDEVYGIKNIKHRNITLCPLDFDQNAEICDRVDICGIQYSVYGFAYTAACFPAMFAASVNHRYFLHYLPDSIFDFFQNDFAKNTCSKCVYAIKDYKSLVLKHPDIQDEHYYGATWSQIIAKNKNEFIEPDTTWINTISLNNY